MTFSATPRRVNGPYDLIAANLPYIARGELTGLSREVRHDPMLALDGGISGLELVGRCVADAPDQLASGGKLALEIGHDQASKVKELLVKAGFVGVEARQDLQGVERFVFGTRGE